MFKLPEIQGAGAAGGLANVEVWAKNGGVWAKSEKVGKECILWQRCNFVGQRKFIDPMSLTDMRPGLKLRVATLNCNLPLAL